MATKHQLILLRRAQHRAEEAEREVRRLVLTVGTAPLETRQLAGALREVADARLAELMDDLRAMTTPANLWHFSQW